MTEPTTERLTELLASNEDARLCVVCGEPLDDQDDYDWPCYDCDPQMAEDRLEDAERESKKVRLQIGKLTAVLGQYEARAALAREMLKSSDMIERMSLAAVWIAANGKPGWPSNEDWPLQ